MSGHTPGPYTAKHTFGGLVVIEAPTGTVASIEKHHHGKGPRGVMEAASNADLLAAAPDLYGLAVEAVDAFAHLLDLGSPVDGDDLAEWFTEWRLRTLQAVAKADASAIARERERHRDAMAEHQALEAQSTGR